MNKVNDIILVDSNDVIMGEAEKLSVHQNNLCHRAFSVFIFRRHNGTLEVLMQKRNREKYHCGGLWTNTCCGHPHPNENTLLAAIRRLQEEMGIREDLKYAGKFHYQVDFDNGLSENEVDHVFYAEYSGDEIKPDPKEIEEYKWINIERLRKAVSAECQQFTPWLQHALNIAMEKMDNNENTNL